MRLYHLLDSFLVSDHHKDWIDVYFSVAVSGSAIAWMNEIVPEVTMLATCFSALAGGIWWVYRIGYMIEQKFRKHNRRKEDTDEDF